MCALKFPLLCKQKKKSLYAKPTSEEISCKNLSHKDIIALQHKNAVDFGKFSFELEEKRGESLIAHSGHMLTAFSLYSAALLTLLGSLLSNEIISRTHLFVSSACIAVPLICALVFTMLAQWRFKYETLIDAEEFRTAFVLDSAHYQEQYQFDFQFITQLHQVQQSKAKMNNKRLLCIRVAMICFFFSIGMLVVDYVVLSFIYT